MPIKLSRIDARLAARGCRNVAAQARKDAAALTDFHARDALLQDAAHAERLAATFEAHAATRLAGHTQS
jgi:hypothetical protein